VDAHQGDGLGVVLLDDLVRDADERAADVVLVEDDLLFRRAPSSAPITPLDSLTGATRLTGARVSANSTST
jgi:hypothetical protein